MSVLLTWCSSSQRGKGRVECIVQVIDPKKRLLKLCVVSGEPPKKPVFSKITGNVFEKHLLEQYLTENQTDPVTQQPATVDDYVELKGILPNAYI